MSSSRVKKFQEIQKIMPQRQVSMNEIRIDKLAFTFKKNNMSLLHTSLQHISRSSKKNKNYCSIIKSCVQAAAARRKKYRIQFLINFWVQIPGL